MKHILLCGVLLCSAVFLPACVTRTRTIKETQVKFTMPPSSPAEQERDGITMTVSTFHRQNAKADPVMTKTVNYSVTPAGGKTSAQRMALTLVPVPFFKVTIRNHTPYVLRLDRALIRLKDDNGNDYPLMTKRDAINWMDAQWEKTEANLATQNVALQAPPMAGQYATIKFITRDTELAPEDSVTGYLAFQIPNQDDDTQLAEWASRLNHLKLQMYQIPCEADEAGNVKRVTKFEYTIKPEVVTNTRTEKYKSLF